METQLESRINEAQLAVVGSMLIDDRCIGKVLAEIGPDDFPQGPYRAAFGCMRRLFSEGKPVDPVTVLDAVQGDSKYANFLRECMEVTPTAANVLEYCRILKRLTRVTKIAALGASLMTVQDMDEAQQLVGELNAQMVEHANAGILSAAELAEDFVQRMQSQEKPEYIGCGIKKLDETTFIELGDVVGIGAAPSTGKTAFALQWASYLAPKYRVGFFSLETNAAKIEDRLFAGHAKVSLTDLKRRNIDSETWTRVWDATARFCSYQFDFIPAAGMSVTDIISTALARRYQVIFVDYLQLVAGEGRRSRDRYEIVTECSMAFHRAAQQHGILTFLLSQLSRPEKIKGKFMPPDMHSFRESGQIEQDLDVALLMYLEDPDNYRSNRKVKLGKNKEGEKALVELTFDGRYQRFEEVRQNPYAQLKTISRQVQRETHRGEADDTGLEGREQIEMQELTGPDASLPF